MNFLLGGGETKLRSGTNMDCEWEGRGYALEGKEGKGEEECHDCGR